VTPDPQRVAKIIRDVAENIILPRFQRLASHEISVKSSGDLVTVADKEAEQALGMALRGLLPGSAIVGEEEAAERPNVLKALLGHDPVWVVDPVDGTQNFANGETCFAVIIALVCGGKTVAGWIHEPIRDATVWALNGEGAYEADKRLKPDAPEHAGDINGSLSRRYNERLERCRIKLDSANKQQLPKPAVRYRCVGAEYNDLARGRLQYACYNGWLKPWDHLAGVLIHAESGGFSALVETGAALEPGPELRQQTILLAPNKKIWCYLMKLLGE